MRVLHILNTNSYSGAENVVCQIINMFKNDQKIEMAYCSFDGPIRDALDERNISFYPISQMKSNEINRVIAMYKPDIIHSHDMKASFIASFSCGKIPIISHIHNNAFDSRRISPKSIAYLFAAVKAKKIIWVSNSSLKGYCFNGMVNKKSRVLYNAIDISELKARLDSDSNIYDYDVVYVGRLTYQKNPQRLMHIIKRVVEKYPYLKVAIVGTGELEDESRRLCEELNLSSNLRFLGFQSNPLRILHDAKVMVMTSRWEGTPMVALEAMALGTPIISTPTDGMNELIVNGENGFLTDNDEKFAECVLTILNDSEIEDRLRKKQIEKSEIINNTVAYKQTISDIYNEVLKENDFGGKNRD